MAIGMALGGACLLYATMVILSVVKGNTVLEGLEATMAVQGIAFEKAIAPPPEPVHEDAHEEPAAVHHDKPVDLHAPMESVDDHDLAMVHNDLNAALPPAPYDGLTEESPFGDLPIIGENKLKPFDAYKKPYIYDVKKPSIALVVSGVGMSAAASDDVYDVLVPNVTLLLSPYLDDIEDVQKKARENGYETWMSLPLETSEFPKADPGSLGILADGGLRFNQDNLRRVLASAHGYAGIAAYTDSAFINAKPMLDGILTDVMVRGLGYFELNARRDSMSLKLAVNNRAPYAAVSLRTREKSVERVFSHIKKIAKNDQSAIGVIEMSPALLSGFQAEMAKAKQEGFEFVPLSALTNTY